MGSPQDQTLCLTLGCLDIYGHKPMKINTKCFLHHITQGNSLNNLCIMPLANDFSEKEICLLEIGVS